MKKLFLDCANVLRSVQAQRAAIVPASTFGETIGVHGGRKRDDKAIAILAVRASMRDLARDRLATVIADFRTSAACR